MSRYSRFADFDFVTVDELTSVFDDLSIERAEVVPTPASKQAAKSSAEDWTAVLFSARLLAAA